jgi:LCP family protein required for cell wall assembly
VGLRIAASVITVIVLGTSGWGWYLGKVAEASVNRTDAIPTSGNTGGGGSAMNLLLVGNDSRASATPAELKQLNTQANPGLNTDTMILVHVPADGSGASFVSFPRDSYVEIPGHGWDKLNAAYADGHEFDAPAGATEAQKEAAGAQLLVRTISQLTGLQIDHYAEVDLLGFFKISTVLGGVQVNLCAPVKDRYSGVNLPAGVQTISGSQALSFVRQRHGLPRGDFDRIIRQQTFIAAMIRKMISQKVLLDLGKQQQLVKAVAGSLTVDQSLNLLGLAGQMQSVHPGAVSFQTIPYVGDDHDSQGRYILRLKDLSTLHEFFAGLSADAKPAAPAATAKTSAAASATPTATVAPSAVTVAVKNGSGITGLAGKAGDALKAAGFTVASTGNADKASYPTTEIHYGPGDQALAATLAAQLPGATQIADSTATSGTVALIIGANFNGVGKAVTASSAAASTTPAIKGEDARTAADTTCIN